MASRSHLKMSVFFAMNSFRTKLTWQIIRLTFMGKRVGSVSSAERCLEEKTIWTITLTGFTRKWSLIVSSVKKCSHIMLVCSLTFRNFINNFFKDLTNTKIYNCWNHLDVWAVRKAVWKKKTIWTITSTGFTRKWSLIVSSVKKCSHIMPVCSLTFKNSTNNFFKDFINTKKIQLLKPLGRVSSLESCLEEKDYLNNHISGFHKNMKFNCQQCDFKCSHIMLVCLPTFRNFINNCPPASGASERSKLA